MSEDQVIELLNQALAAGPLRSRIARTVLDESEKIIAEHLLNASLSCECPPCKAVQQLMTKRPQ